MQLSLIHISPEINDDLAKECSEFDTIDEWKEDIEKKLIENKKMQNQNNIKNEAMKEIYDEIIVDTVSYTHLSWKAYGSGYSNKSDWRRDNVNKLVAELDTKLHLADSSIRFGISPQGIWANSTTMPNGSATKGNEAYTQKFADCLAWINAGTIDYICLLYTSRCV